jgi:hypothetical protein
MASSNMIEHGSRGWRCEMLAWVWTSIATIWSSFSFAWYLAVAYFRVYV